MECFLLHKPEWESDDKFSYCTHLITSLNFYGEVIDLVQTLRKHVYATYCDISRL